MVARNLAVDIPILRRAPYFPRVTERCPTAFDPAATDRFGQRRIDRLTGSLPLRKRDAMMHLATIIAGAPPLPRPRGTTLLAVCAAILLAGCGSSRVQVNDIHPPSPSSDVISDAESEIVSNVEPRLRTEISRWEGTPHVNGGATATGMDCSAFVQRIYADVFDVDLPRTTRDQVNAGEAVDRDHLKPGDLVFFRPPTKTRHVGVYLSDGEFAHVSSSQGVTVSALDLPYWRRAYWTSRRILPSDLSYADGARQPAPAVDKPDERRVPDSSAAAPNGGRRGGW